MLFLAVGLLIISVTLVLVHNRRQVPYIALGTCVLLAALIPNFGPSDEFLIILSAGCAAIGIVAISRALPEGTEGFARRNWWILAYIVYSATIAIVFLPPASGAFRAVTTVGLIAIVIVARRATATPSNYFPIVIGAIVLLEVLFGATEALFGQDAIWPRPDGSDRFTSRVNHLAPWLVGRVLGSLAGPIPYGTFAGFGLIVAMWMIVERKRKGYAFLLVGSGFGLLMSGTRSAIIAVIVVVAVWLVSRSSASRPVTIALGIIGAALFVMLSDVSQIFGLEGVEDTNSFEHRNEILGSVGQILTLQHPLAVIFGNGDNARNLLTDGVVTVTTGVTVYDNQVVRELAASGIIGLFLLAAGIIAGLRRGNGLSRMIIVFTAMMFFSFDALTWRVITIVFLIACAGPLAAKPSPSSAAISPVTDRTFAKPRR